VRATTGVAMSLAVRLRLPWGHPAAGSEKPAAVSLPGLSGTIWARAAGPDPTGARPGAGARAVDSAQIFARLSMLRRCCSGCRKGQPE